MNRKVFRIAGAAALLLLLVVMAGCVTTSSIGGTSDPHGLFGSKGAIVSDGATEIASYSVILGLFESKYADYAAAVQAAEAGGKTITTVTKSYMGFFTKVTAYTR